jgi:hypothetical protein
MKKNSKNFFFSKICRSGFCKNKRIQIFNDLYPKFFFFFSTECQTLRKTDLGVDGGRGGGEGGAKR